ncbi:MAG: sodium:proton exchanger [Bacteroidetes bacterium]|nr:MAG: sodium:proton exchanger [Bacteroidota bacterium]GIV57360.1 MAG: hypothetical protein KatS3mg042_0273 [Rhodothermaceae bacterium]
MELSILNLFLVLLVAWLAGSLASRWGYPSVLGELLAGILLGPPLLGWLHGSEALAVLAEVGILLMMVYIGMEIDPRELGRASKAGLLAALGGFITPFVLAYLIIVETGGTPMAGIFVGIAAGVTSLATKSRILVDLKLLDTRIAHVMMAGALIADTLSLVVFAAVIGVAEAAQVDAAGLALVAGKAVLFFAGATLLGMKVFPAMGRALTRLPSFERTALFTLVLLIALVYAELAELAGMHGILGAFLAGLFLRENVFGRTRSKEIMELVRDASLGFLAPIFFVTAGFAVSLDVFSTDLGLLVGIVAVATLGKIVGTALFYLPTGYGWREGLTVGAGMNGRGAVEIILAQIGLTLGLISQEIFSILVFMAIFTTATVPVLLKWGTDWLRRRGELVRSDEEREGAVILGAGPTARALGRLLARSMPVLLIDRNRERCDLAEADGLSVICGNALDEQVLSEAGLGRARHLIALTANAEVNALAAERARLVFFVPEVHILHTGNEEGHAALVHHLGAHTLFGGPVDMAVWDVRLDHDEAAYTHVVLEEPVPAARLFERLGGGTERLPLVVEREGTFLPFHADLALVAGDRVTLLQTIEDLPDVFDRFDRLVARCPVLDIEQSVTLDAFLGMAAGVLAPRLDVDVAPLAQRFEQRERVRASVLLPGLAIPHVLIEGEGKFEVLLARCREGVVFPGEAERVHTLFVLAGTEDQRTFHLQVLSAIAQIIQREDFEKEWLMAPDAEALRALVLRAPRRRLAPEPAGDPEAAGEGDPEATLPSGA